MNSFGLGLVLNFVDNASSGMINATRTFEQMSATADAMASSVSMSITDMVTACYALDSVGSTLQNIGGSILDVYGDITQKVIDSGMEMQGYRMQLAALYGSIEAGEEKLDEIKQYAMSSVFDIQSLIPAVTMMKAVGIEAMEEVTTSSGKATQRLLDYASDIAAMVPNMRNTYGTGVQAAMGAIKEYIAEGNALSLKRGAGLDILGILGQEKGASIEERTQQVADLVEKLNILGYTAQLAGTPTQRLSNMQDALFNSLTKIADSGVFEKYCDLLEKLSNWVFSLVEDEETFNTITGVLADTITTLLTPLEMLLDFLIANGDAIIGWIKRHPVLTKNILVTVAAIGALLVAGGSLLRLISSIGMAGAGLSFLKTLPTILGKIGAGFGTVITKAAPFLALAGIAYFVWSKNLFGIRDALTKVFDDIAAISSIIADAWDDNTLSAENFLEAQERGILPLIEAILQLKYYWEYFVEGFKEGFREFFDGLAESLSWLKVFGIDVNKIAAAVGEFLDSLIQIGQEDTWRNIGEVVGNLAAALVTLATVATALKPIISIVNAIAGVFATVHGWIGKVIGGIGSIITVLKGGQGVGFFTKMLEVLMAVFSGSMSLKDALTVVFGSAATTLGGVITLISGIATAAKGFIEQLNNGFSTFWEIVKWIGIALGVVGAIILGAAAWPAVIVGAVIGVLTTLIVLIKDNWQAICDFFSNAGTWINDNVIQPVANFFSELWDNIVEWAKNAIENIKTFFSNVATWINDNVIIPVKDFFVGLWNSIVDGVKSAIDSVKTFLGNIADWVYNNVILPVRNFFATLLNFVVGLAVTFWNWLTDTFSKLATWVDTNIIQPIKDFAKSLWDNIVNLWSQFTDWVNTNIIQPVVDFVKGLWDSIVEFAQNLWNDIVEIWNALPGWIDANIIQPIVQFSQNLWNDIVNLWSQLCGWVQANIIDPVVNFFTQLWQTIVQIATNIYNGFCNAIMGLANWVYTNVISPVVNFFTQLWQSIVDIATNIYNGFCDALSNIANWVNDNVISPVVDFFKGLWDSIVTIVNGIKDTITGAFQAAYDAVVGVWSGIVDFFRGIWESISGWFSNIVSAGEQVTGIQSRIPAAATGVHNFVGGLIQVNEKGGELINLPSGSTVIPHDESIQESLEKGINIGASSLAMYAKQQQSSGSPSQTAQNDYSITFQAGSVVIQLANATDAELERAAEKLMKIIERKQQLRQMAVRA